MKTLLEWKNQTHPATLEFFRSPFVSVLQSIRPVHRYIVPNETVVIFRKASRAVKKSLMTVLELSEGPLGNTMQCEISPLKDKAHKPERLVEKRVPQLHHERPCTVSQVNSAAVEIIRTIKLYTCSTNAKYTTRVFNSKERKRQIASCRKYEKSNMRLYRLGTRRTICLRSRYRTSRDMRMVNGNCVVGYLA